MNPVYVVLARCNFDDVLVGVYASVHEAIARAEAIEAKPKRRFLAGSGQANDTEYLHTTVYRAAGDAVEHVMDTHGNDPPEFAHHKEDA